MRKISGTSIKAIVRREGDALKIFVERGGKKIKRRFGFGKFSKLGLELTIEEMICLSNYFSISFFEGKRRLKIEDILPNFSSSQIFRKATVLLDIIHRGYKAMAGPPPFDVSVWKRGRDPEREAPGIWIKIYSELENFSPKEIYENLRISLINKRELLLAVIDRDSEISYYKVTIPDISGSFSFPKRGEIKGFWAGDMAIVVDPPEWIAEGTFGKRIGRFLYLSQEEALFLKDLGVLKIEGTETDRDLAIRYQVYKDLRGRGCVPKSGYKFGGVFRVYCLESEEHSKYIVNPVSEDWKIRWCYFSSMARTVRGVRKILVFGIPTQEGIRYISIERILP